MKATTQLALAERSLKQAAKQVARLLKQKNQKLVLVESCTGGMVSAALTQIPGISEWLCGSLVVYRSESKAQWLKVPKAVLRKPGPVSEEMSQVLSRAALKYTSEATLAAAVTGYLGPTAPLGRAGEIFLSVKFRGSSEEVLIALKLKGKNRVLHQIQASTALLFLIADRLSVPLLSSFR